MTDAEYENRLHNIYKKHYKEPISYDQWNNKIKNLPQNYQLQFKDNFWDLSGHWFQDSLYWSKLWVANPKVENPHRIFKGDLINLDIFALSQIAKSHLSADLLDQFGDLNIPQSFSRSALEEEDFPSSLPYIPIVLPEVEFDFSQLDRFRPPYEKPIPYYLSNQAPPKEGEIIGANSYGKFFGTTGETLILNLSHSSSKGSLYTVFETKKSFFSADIEVQIKALLKITDFIQGSGLYKAQVVFALDKISLNDSLFKGMPPSYNRNPTKLGKIQGLIVGSPSKSLLASVDDFVYLNKGSADGLSVEDSFPIIPISKKNFFKRPNEKTKNPVGTLKVIHTARKKSTAIILSANDSIYLGDQFTSLISHIDVEIIPKYESLEEGSNLFEEIEEVETPESFIDESLQDPQEREDDEIVEEFEFEESSSEDWGEEFETETTTDPKIKDLDDQEDEVLEDEFQFFIEEKDLEEKNEFDEGIQLEKETLEVEIESKEEISLRDENLTDDTLTEEFEEFEEPLESPKKWEEETLQNLDKKILENLDQDTLEELDEEDLQDLTLEDLEEIEFEEEDREEEFGDKETQDETNEFEEFEEEDLEDETNELEEFEEIDVL